MIFLQAMMAFGMLLMLMAGIFLVVGIPLATFLLVQKSRRKLQIPASKSLPFWQLAANFLLAVIIVSCLFWLLAILLDQCIDGRFN